MSEEKGEKEFFPIHIIFMHIFIAAVFGLVHLRILVHFFDWLSWLKILKDIDFRILLEGVNNGLINFYDPITLSEYPPYYLYFWYFIFFPMTLFHWEISATIWDGIRLTLSLYVLNEARKMFKNFKDLLIFYILASIGFLVDAFYGNNNFLVLFFLFQSYVFLEKDKKWLAGIFFTLATFKINSFLFLPILLISKKIKIKDLKYFLVPFFLVCIPYMIFPEYFMQMVSNWMYGSENVNSDSIFIATIMMIDMVAWKALQPSHLLFYSLIQLIFLENIKSEIRKKRFRITLLLGTIIYYARMNVLLFIIPTLFFLKFL